MTRVVIRASTWPKRSRNGPTRRILAGVRLAAEARDEIDHLTRELARVEGLGGRPRPVSDTERARVSVTKAIRLALARIADASPELGAVLLRAVRTGSACRYSAAAE